MPDSEILLDEWPLRALVATLDTAESLNEPLTTMPPLWHWLYFLPTIRRRDLGADGHRAESGGTNGGLPERRMFAAARTEFRRLLRVGAAAHMMETTLHSRRTQGKSGPLRIVTVEYLYIQEGELRIGEEREIVYLPAFTPAYVAAPRVVDSRQPRLLRRLLAEHSVRSSRPIRRCYFASPH
jgi:3-methylfumaryl-CoA hydratase